METQGQQPNSGMIVLPPSPQQPQVQPGQQQSADQNAVVRKILETLAQQSQRKQFAGQPVPQNIPQGGDRQAAMNIGMNTANPHAWGAQRMMASIGANIKTAVAKKKQDQLLQAEGDWNALASSLNELYAAQQSGDQKAVAAAQAKVDVTLGDQKKLKNMAKALNQDWLNPEKTTVYGEALKRVAAQQEQKKQQEGKKQQAVEGIRDLFKKLIGQNKQLKESQMTPDERTAMAREIQEKAPTSTGGDIKQTQEIAKTYMDIEQASKNARENYFPPVADENGVLRSVNKSNPSDVVTVRDASTGKDVKGIPKGGAPKPLMNGGVPYAIARNGKVVMPGGADWTKDDQALLDRAMGAAKEKQMLRLAPEIAAQIGEPPDPKEYKKGRSDPEYAKALATYGKQAETIRDRESTTLGVARAKAFNEYRPVQAMDDDGNVYYTTAKDAISQKLSGASEGVKLKPREQQMTDIQVASGKMRDAITGLDKPFSPDQIAKLHLALTTPDDTLANAEMATLATQNLTDKQQDFVVWTKQLNERAMSLRNVAGMGAGAQDLRNAIRDMIPGVRSGSKEMMFKQLDAFDNQVKILRAGVAHPGGKTATKDKDKDPLGIL
jgi:hypothetical protein